MQPSALYRRGIVVPLNDDAEEKLRAYNVDSNTKVHVLSIPDQELFESLWRCGLFKEINQRCCALLDDYEEEIIEASSVAKISAAVGKVGGTALEGSKERAFLRELDTLVSKAVELSRPMLFVL